MCAKGKVPESIYLQGFEKMQALIKGVSFTFFPFPFIRIQVECCLWAFNC